MAKDALRMRVDGQVDDKERRKICRHMATCWHKQTQGLLGAKTFVQLLQHPTFSNLQQTSLKVERAIFLNICNTLSEVKIPHSNNELFLKRAIVMACLNVNSSSNKILLSNKIVAGVLGVHRRSIIFANLRLQIEEDNGKLCLSACQCQAHQTSNITPEIKDLVFEFWAMETYVSPNKKDICQKRIGRKAMASTSSQLGPGMHTIFELSLGLHMIFGCTVAFL